MKYMKRKAAGYLERKAVCKVDVLEVSMQALAE